MLNINNENSGYFTQNISECNITGTLAVLSDLLMWSLFYSFNFHTKYWESCDKPILTERGIPRYIDLRPAASERNFDLHLTHLNCAISSWATNKRIICHPIQMLLAFATGWMLILIPEIDSKRRFSMHSYRLCSGWLHFTNLFRYIWFLPFKVCSQLGRHF